MIYLLVILSLSFLALFNVKNYMRSAPCVMLCKSMLFFTLFICFYLSAFRYKTGADWNNYIPFFNHCFSPSASNFEYGFVILNQVAKYLFNNFYILQFFISFFCCCTIYYAIGKYALIPAVSFLFYFLNYFMNVEMAQTRQFIAMAVLIVGTKFIRKRELVKWILTVILACQFHITACIAFPLYFTERIVLSAKAAVLLTVCAGFINLFGHAAIIKILNVLSLPFFSFLPHRILDLLYLYTNLQEYADKAEYNSGLGFIISNFIYLFIVLLYSNSNKQIKEKTFLLNFLIGILFNALGRNFEQFIRIGYYYFICGFGVSAWGILFYKNAFFKKIEWLQLFFSVFIIAFFVFSFFKVWYLPKNGAALISSYVPYKSFMFKDYTK